jgi:ferric-chelate reductase
MKKALEIFFLIALLVVCAGFTIGLTYAPCYASLCTEEFLPYETRVHVASFYAFVASIACLLFLRAYNRPFRRLSEHYLATYEVAILRRRISVGGLFFALFILVFGIATTAIWVKPEIDFWSIRTNALDHSSVKIPLVVTGITAHHLDLLVGLLLIPVSRNSILGRVFAVHQSTLLYAHKLLGYLTYIGVFAHGVAAVVSDRNLCYASLTTNINLVLCWSMVSGCKWWYIKRVH